MEAANGCTCARTRCTTTPSPSVAPRTRVDDGRRVCRMLYFESACFLWIGVAIPLRLTSQSIY